MTAIFESKVASCGDIEDRLETLTRVIRAFVDCWLPRVQDLHARQEEALAAYDARHPHAAVHLSRALIEARFEEELDALTREGMKHRQGLDQLVEFYRGDDLDLSACTIH
jgi:hypothetical protein